MRKTKDKTPRSLGDIIAELPPEEREKALARGRELIAKEHDRARKMEALGFRKTPSVGSRRRSRE